MKITSCQFLKTISLKEEKISYDHRNQVIFLWRSNVGKSSLMNAIFQKKDLVKTSSTPGKTKNANIFLLNHKYEFVDLPWYGYARWEKDLSKTFDELLNWYLEEFKYDIKKVVLVMDSKIWPTKSDIDMYKFLQGFDFSLLFVLNKIDKLGNHDIKQSLNHTQEIFFGQQVVWVSAKKNIWIDTLRKDLLKSVEQK